MSKAPENDPGSSKSRVQRAIYPFTAFAGALAVLAGLAANSTTILDFYNRLTGAGAAGPEIQDVTASLWALVDITEKNKCNPTKIYDRITIDLTVAKKQPGGKLTECSVELGNEKYHSVSGRRYVPQPFEVSVKEESRRVSVLYADGAPSKLIPEFSGQLYVKCKEGVSSVEPINAKRKPLQSPEWCPD